MKFNRIGFWMIGATMVATSLIAFKSKGPKFISAKKHETNFVLAKTNNELTAIRSNVNANIIRSLHDFDEIVANEYSPLNKISKFQLDHFRENIVEREGVGIVGLKYDDLQSQLSYDDFAEVMGMFGVDVKEGFWGLSQDPKIIDQLAGRENAKKIRGASVSTSFEDYEGYRCAAKYTCQKQSGSICMSGC